MLEKIAAGNGTRAASGPAAADGLSAQERYFRAQARAVYRVHAPQFPDQRIRVVLKALDHPWGDPGSVQIHAGDAHLELIDEAYMGYMDFGDSGVSGAAAEDTGKTGPEIAATIVAGVPRPLRRNETVPEKTAPDFGRRPALRRLLRASPVLFEQLKYHYETRQRKLCPSRHSFRPLGRASRHPMGGAGDTRDTTKPPAILIGFHWLETGGAEKLAFDCVAWARAAGLRVLVVAERADMHRQAHRLPEDVAFIRADAYLAPDQWFTFLEHLIRTENIRALHIHHNVRLYENLMRLKAVFPDLVTIDSTHIVEHENGGFPRTSGVWTNYIDHHHVISRELVSFYLDRFNVSDRVLLGRMLEPGDAGGLPDLRLGAGQKSLRLAFVGRLVHQKRAPLAVAILQRLRKWARAQGIGLHLDMVGTGPYLEVVRQMIRQANLGQIVTLHPADSDVPALLGQADILLLPSGNEGLALVCYEAIENGALPVSTDVGGQDELVAEALLVPAAPLACLRETAARIRRLASDPAFLERSKAETLARYAGLRADPTAEQVLGALYRRILDNSPPTAAAGSPART